MKYLILSIFFYSVISCSDSLKTARDIDEFRRLNQFILSFYSDVRGEIPLESISINTLRNQIDINELIKKYDLSEIHIYSINGVHENIGISYKIQEQSNKSYKYLLYSKNIGSKKTFETYEQFVDCGITDSLDLNWSLVTISNCLD